MGRGVKLGAADATAASLEFAAPRVTQTLGPRLPPVCDWLLRGVSRDLKVEDLVDQLNQLLVECGTPVWRCSLNIHTFHPEVFVRNLVWSAGAGCQSEIVSHFDTLLPTFKDSPVALIYDGAGPIRRRLAGPGAVLDFPILADLASQGATDYLILPLGFSDGRRTFASFCTMAPAGFSDADIESLLQLAPYLALRIELESANFAKSSLLQLYLGRSAASRVLDGNFTRGQGQRIEAAIWYCDLRDFTAMTGLCDSEEVVGLLDGYFEIVANAIQAQGGEILKFIGDAVLACFDVAKHDSRAAACDRALAAARRALSDLRIWDELGETAVPIRAGIALHCGTVLFGNIGSHERLDFTVIGAAINEVCRLEPLCKSLGVPLVLSEDFAQLTSATAELRSLGRHELRGVPELREAFTLADLVAAP